jgi:hypothetical protein
MKSEITSTFDSVIYLVAEERARGIRGMKEGDGEHIINNEESYPKRGHWYYGMHLVSQ